MNDRAKVVITLDADDVIQQLVEAKEHIEALDPDSKLQALERIQGLLDAPDLGIKLGAVDFEGDVAPRTGELRARAEFTDGLAHFVTALRAGDVDAALV